MNKSYFKHLKEKLELKVSVRHYCHALSDKVPLLSLWVLAFRVLAFRITVRATYQTCELIWITVSSPYMSNHPHLVGDTCISKFSTAFTRILHKSLFLMKTKLPRQIFLQEEILVIDLSVFHEISYVWVMKFKSIFYYLAIWFSKSIGRHNKDKH